ncbi:HAD-superfamily hydrolase subfamily IA [Nitrosococcus oceani ATCC 19707]|uniref:HAD-superfamily hydrolase subfamily IA n=2 Tax=Nitrosococcus oceani TaxID=1229 RepID=Q3JEN5_NITOC|nr:HAD-IA family hydrolase [Nitrosococcus oceani]ABA56711.1 HAD-superfamily hydrolase subfamily IA [Nitrosococcus oceani ATCC 19707]EDZ65732.1 haloacid dehalogenase-like hydrolase, putative [Nitrosococcus oceani AFC27]KFI20846.1 HAD family hydrolase [Nitrosococcus oceani C-27]
MSPYKLIVFDWDGTLMDSEARIVASMRSAIHDLSFPFREDAQLRNVIGLGLPEALAMLYPEGDKVMKNALVERYRHYYLSADLTPSQLFEGVEELLGKLHEQGYLMAIATGKGRSGLDRVLPEVGVAHYFCTSRCADETASKPNPRMLLEIMAQTQARPEETLMVGDTEYDLLMAKYAGTDALAVSYGVHEKTRLQQCGPIGCVDSVTALEGWLSAGPAYAARNASCRHG